MALTLLLNSLVIEPYAHRAEGKHNYAELADLPVRGDIATWVDGSSDWYVDNVRQEPQRNGSESWNEAVITARRPGFDWTWVGLRPISSRGRYSLTRSTDYDDGVVYGYWPMFSNWNSAWNWTDGGNDTLLGQLKTWEVEWVDTVSRQAWHNRRNGAWPTGFDPPAGRLTAGIYLCTAIEVVDEPYMDTAGQAVTYYRHFATFWESPIVTVPNPDVRLLWRHDAWI